MLTDSVITSITRWSIDKLTNNFLIDVTPGTKEIVKDDWIVFVKVFEKEKFTVNFPREPFSMSYDLKNFEKRCVFLKAKKEGVNYAIQITPKYRDNTKMVFKDILKRFKNFSPLELMEFSFSENGNFLDLFFKDNSLSVFCRTRVIVTKNNIYSLFTFYKEKEAHNSFIKSFRIVS